VAGTPANNANEIWGTFVGAIDQASAYRFAHWLGLASGKPVHLAFQSAGGMVGDGIFIYELLRNAPSPVTLYSLGAVSSIAALAFLGAKKKCVGAYATFMLHRTTFTAATPSTGAALAARVQTLAIDDQRTERILRLHLRLDSARWNDLDGNDVWFTAQEAVAVGFADEIADFAPPTGTTLWDFNLAVQGVSP
jgi:ATP-dependent Clp protease, protease subunit